MTFTIKSLFLCLHNFANRYMAASGLMLFAVDLADPEVKQAIKDAVEAAVQPLADKRDELLNEVKNLRKGKQINPEDLEKIEQERDEWKSKAEKATKDVTKLTGERDKAIADLKTESEITTSAHKERDLTEQLAALNVTNPHMLKAAKALLSSQAQVVLDGDKRVTKVGDKALADHLKEWAATEEGKSFISAPNNSGGSSQGSNGGQGGGKTIKQSDLDAMNPKDRAAKMEEPGIKVID